MSRSGDKIVSTLYIDRHNRMLSNAVKVIMDTDYADDMAVMDNTEGGL